MLSVQLNFCDPSRCILYRIKSHRTRLSLTPNNVELLLLIIIRVPASPSSLVLPVGIDTEMAGQAISLIAIKAFVPTGKQHRAFVTVTLLPP